MSKVRIIPPGSNDVIEYDVLPSDKFGYPPGTTQIAEDHWDLVKDKLAEAGIKVNALQL